MSQPLWLEVSRNMLWNRGRTRWGIASTYYPLRLRDDLSAWVLDNLVNSIAVYIREDLQRHSDDLSSYFRVFFVIEFGSEADMMLFKLRWADELVT